MSGPEESFWPVIELGGKGEAMRNPQQVIQITFRAFILGRIPRSPAGLGGDVTRAGTWRGEPSGSSSPSLMLVTVTVA